LTTHNFPMKTAKHIVNPIKLLRSQWTATTPVDQEKHFMVTKIMMPELIDQAIKFIESEAVISGRKQWLSWKALNDKSTWLQGWT